MSIIKRYATEDYVESEIDKAIESNVSDGNWVLIENSTLEEDTLVFERTAEPDGTPYNLDAVKLIIKVLPGQEGASYHVAGYDYVGTSAANYIVGGAAVMNAPLSTATETHRGSFVFNASPLYGLYNCWAASGNQGGVMNLTTNTNAQNQTTPTSKKIKRIRLHIYDNKVLLTGTSIEIWGGVRTNA